MADVVQDTTALPRPARIFLLVSCSLAALSAAAAGLSHFIFHWGPPYNWPFFPFQHYCDFWNFHDRFDHYHELDFYSTSGGSPFSYPPPLTLMYALFFLPKHSPHSLFVLATTTPLIALALILARSMLRLGISKSSIALLLVPTALLSYPFWFEFLLGNIEICVFLLVAFGLLAWLRGHSYTAAIFIGAAGSMKLFPFVYLALFLSRKQYRQFALGLLTAAMLYPISIWLACPSFSIALPGIKKSSAALGRDLVLHWDFLLTYADHSLFGVYKQVLHLLGASNSRPPFELSIYMMVVAVGGILLYFLAIRKLPIVNQILALSVAAVLLPPMSHDYTLLYLYFPWGLLVIAAIRYAKADQKSSGMIAVFVCLALLFSPENELSIGHAAVAGQFKSITLAALLYLSLRYRFASVVEPSNQKAVSGEVLATASSI